MHSYLNISYNESEYPHFYIMKIKNNTYTYLDVDVLFELAQIVKSTATGLYTTRIVYSNKV